MYSKEGWIRPDVQLLARTLVALLIRKKREGNGIGRGQERRGEERRGGKQRGVGEEKREGGECGRGEGKRHGEVKVRVGEEKSN